VFSTPLVNVSKPLIHFNSSIKPIKFKVSLSNVGELRVV
jgi:hypothetical protein